LHELDLRERRVPRSVRRGDHHLLEQWGRDLQHDGGLQRAGPLHEHDVRERVVHRVLRSQPDSVRGQHAADLQYERILDELVRL
jgi:hypothetical protein